MSYRRLDLDSRNFVSIRLEIIERKKLDGKMGPKNGTRKNLKICTIHFVVNLSDKFVSRFSDAF